MLRISADGVARYTDPYRQPDSLTVGQVRFAAGGRLIVGNEIPNVFPDAEGYFCPETVGVGRYVTAPLHLQFIPDGRPS
jgi:hypothetical protein